MLKLAKTTLFSVLLSLSMTLAAEPLGYSINSDSGSADPIPDSLYQIDLELGTEKRIGPLDPRYLDVEGLAFDPDGKLWALDDDLLRVFELNKTNGKAELLTEKQIFNLPSGGGNDFGMTFACDRTLYVTSVAERKLYRLSLSGQATPIGSLGANISALAAWGNPTELYGLGNGLRRVSEDVFEEDAPYLYRIDPMTGAATKLGELGGLAAPYTEGGLDFDAFGQLWAITDRIVPDNQPSQVMKIDKVKGTASSVKTLKEAGFESLAIASPGGCTLIDDGAPPVTDPVQGSSQVRSVPTLGGLGLTVTIMLMLLAGLVAVRRL
jgi:hypothetical protein